MTEPERCHFKWRDGWGEHECLAPVEGHNVFRHRCLCDMTHLVTHTGDATHYLVESDKERIDRAVVLPKRKV